MIKKIILPILLSSIPGLALGFYMGKSHVLNSDNDYREKIEKEQHATPPHSPDPQISSSLVDRIKTLLPSDLDMTYEQLLKTIDKLLKDRTYENDITLIFLCYQFGHIAPEETIQHLISKRRGDLFIPYVLGGWSNHEPEKAGKYMNYLYILRNSDPSLSYDDRVSIRHDDYIYGEIIYNFAKKDPNTAWELLTKTGLNTRTNILTSYLAALIDSDSRKKLAEHVRSLNTPGYPINLLPAAILSYPMNYDPNAIYLTIKLLQENKFNPNASELDKGNIAAALLEHGVPDGMIEELYFKSQVLNFSICDPDGFIRFLETIPPGLFREHVTNDTTSYYNEEMELDPYNEQRPCIFRHLAPKELPGMDTLEMIVQHWGEDFPDKAKKWVNDLPISTEDKQRLLSQIPHFNNKNKKKGLFK